MRLCVSKTCLGVYQRVVSEIYCVVKGPQRRGRARQCGRWRSGGGWPGGLSRPPSRPERFQHVYRRVQHASRCVQHKYRCVQHASMCVLHASSCVGHTSATRHGPTVRTVEERGRLARRLVSPTVSPACTSRETCEDLI